LLGNRSQAQLKWAAVEKKIVKKMTNIRKRQKSQDSRIKTLFAEILNFKSYFCKLCMVTVNDSMILRFAVELRDRKFYRAV
jgi:VanZ family protein